jgi:molybdopterin synthase sulfur carrier subunit
MSVVRIPPVLRGVVGGSRELPASGGTVGEVLDGLFTGHPALADRLRPDGTLSTFVNVYVNGDDIRHRDGLETLVEDGDVVILLPAMAGGAPRSGQEARSSSRMPTIRAGSSGPMISRSTVPSGPMK